MRRCPEVAAAVFACACGCHHDSSFTDAGGGRDARGPDASTPTTVTVTTYSRCCSEANHTLEPNIEVLAVQPDGSVGPSGTTDATGTIVLTGVQPGASVSALYPNGTDFQLVTVAGVQLGDHLTFGDEYADLHGPATGTMTLDLPALASATSVQAWHTCGSDFSSTLPLTSMTLNTSCDAPTGDIFVLASDINGTVIATGTLHGVAYGNGQTATLAAWTPVTTPDLTLSASGLSAQVTTVTLTGVTVVDGAIHYSGATFPTPTGGSASGTTQVPNGGDRLAGIAQIYDRTDGYGEKEQFVRDASTARALAFTEPGLPWLGTATYDATARTASWTQVGSGGYDGALVDVTWNRSETLDAGVVNHNYNWHIILPPGVTSYAWTAPPAALAAYVPATTDTINGTVMLVDLSSASDYDAFRQVPEWQIACPGCDTLSGVLPTGSSVALQVGAEGYSGLLRTTPDR